MHGHAPQGRRPVYVACVMLVLHARPVHHVLHSAIWVALRCAARRVELLHGHCTAWPQGLCNNSLCTHTHAATHVSLCQLRCPTLCGHQMACTETVEWRQEGGWLGAATKRRPPHKVTLSFARTAPPQPPLRPRCCCCVQEARPHSSSEKWPPSPCAAVSCSASARSTLHPWFPPLSGPSLLRAAAPRPRPPARLQRPPPAPAAPCCGELFSFLLCRGERERKRW